MSKGLSEAARFFPPARTRAIFAHMNARGIVSLVFAAALTTATLSTVPGAQEVVAPSWVARVDALFAPWDKPDSPGCALGVMRGGKLVHARGFGQASLEHGVPISARTVFDIGSTSKQFTAASIGLLVQDGKLGLEDEIHDWVPELPPWDQEVSLERLLHHTSGIPDYLSLMFRAGVQEADWTTPEDALLALGQVDKLHFLPGERFEYSNSNYFLLALVIERAAGEAFPVFARQRIFEPLGMTSTLLFHDHTLVVPHRATGYLPRTGGGFQVAMSDFEQLGDGAVQTTIEDLLRWDTNFATHQVGGDALQAYLHHPASLENGSSIEYAHGLIVDTFRGLARVSHGGAWAGFRAELMRFPDEQTSIAILCNLGSMNPSLLCERVAGVVLEDELAASK